MPAKENFSEIVRIAPETADLVMSGIQWLANVDKRKNEVSFTDWARAMRLARSGQDEISREKLFWLWEAITTEPSIKRSLGSKVVSIDEQWKRLSPVTVVEKGTLFGIFLKGFRAYGSPLFLPKVDTHADAEFEITADLRMKPGKTRRLECMDVSTTLRMYVKDIGTQASEAVVLKLPKEAVKTSGNLIAAEAKSLNHVYTVASRRLEPLRRSHGGRAYDHIALKDKKGFVPLETIRVQHEKRLWSKIAGD